MTRRSMTDGTPERPTSSRSRERKISDLVRELIEQSNLLLRQEIELARQEIEQNIRTAASNAGRIAVGIVLLLLGALVLIAFAVVGLGMLLGGRYWLSTLLVALFFLLIGGVLVLRGLSGFGQTSLAPRRALESVQASRAWLATEVAGMRRLFRRAPLPQRLVPGATEVLAAPPPEALAAGAPRPLAAHVGAALPEPAVGAEAHAGE